MRYPEFVENKDILGFAAPAFGASREPYRSGFDNALKKFKRMGYGTLLGPNCYAGDGIGISTSPEKCGAELTDIYCGDLGACSAIISCGGGELMCQTMEHVDFDRVKAAEPKWYCGYSDNTNFIFTLATMCDTAAIYGPNAPAFGMRRWHQNLHDTMDILTGRKLSVETYGKWEIEGLKSEENPLAPYNCTKKTVLKLWTPETDGVVGMKRWREENAVSEIKLMHGRLLGGCMDILAMLCGTRFDHVKEFNERYAEDGVIWFLEACDLNVLGMRRALWQLENAGWFDNARGFMIGRPYLFDQPLFGLDQYEAVLEICRRHNVPVIMDADIGHLPPSMPLVSGSLADVYAAGKGVRVDMQLV